MGCPEARHPQCNIEFNQIIVFIAYFQMLKNLLLRELKFAEANSMPSSGNSETCDFSIMLAMNCHSNMKYEHVQNSIFLPAYSILLDTSFKDRVG